MTCRTCHIEKPDDEFLQVFDKRRPHLPPYRLRACRSCERERVKRYRAVDPDAIKEYRLSARRRLTTLRSRGAICTMDEVVFLLRREACDVCALPVEGKNRHIDHDHSSGRLRGVLCNNCNLALGHVKDSTTVLRALIAYLEGDAAEPLSSAHAERRKAAEIQASGAGDGMTG